MTGILQIERIQINPNWYQLGYDEETGRPCVSFQIPRTETALVSLVRDGRITFANAHLVDESICSVCRQDYFACNCSKYLDEPVHQEMVRAPFVELVWTNRPASPRMHVSPD